MQARDSLDLLASLDWTPIVVALITLSGVIFNTLVGLFIWSQLRTPSGKSIGKQVEDTNHVALANHYRVRALAKALGQPGEPEIPGERARTE